MRSKLTHPEYIDTQTHPEEAPRDHAQVFLQNLLDAVVAYLCSKLDTILVANWTKNNAHAFLQNVQNH
jgi:hypothetical protein